MTWPDVVHLRRGGTSVLVDLTATPNPSVVYWGPDLGELTHETAASQARAARPQRVSGGTDETAVRGLVATSAGGWLGTPTIEGHRDGAASFRFEVTDVEATDASVVVSLRDDEAEADARYELHVGSAGLVRHRLSVANVGDSPLEIQRLEPNLPLPWESTELLDTSGRHLRERSPQRHRLTFGTHLRESRRGRPGADATLFLAVGRPGFGFESGRVHAIHVGWSGNHRAYAERTNTGYSFLAGGELYGPGELRLPPGDQLTSPWVFGSWGDGLTELSHRFHAEWRARPQHPRRPRPVTLNTWEAVYFVHDLAKLRRLARAAARVGVERFVLDDGWFNGRRDDTAGLGDWYVDHDVWPEGLTPLIETVIEEGMEFGLWFEPEMINPVSELARDHPEWILRARSSLPPSARQQQVLNLANPDAYEYVRARIDAVLDSYPIAYIKWDHNRDLLDAGGGMGTPLQVHEHTLALYRLLDELRAAHPGLEIESCASGGARVDLGILDRTDRVWTSDCLDPIERIENQKYTSVVVPPEMMGMHLTSPSVHSTGRTVALNLSGAVALFGHFGIEWDLTVLDDAGLARVAEWVALAKEVRPLVATGKLVHADTGEDGIDVRGVVAEDRRTAFVTITQTTTLVASPSGNVRVPGLDPDALYEIAIRTPGGHVEAPAQSGLPWEHGTVLTGRQLSEAGIRPPVQNPQQSTVISLHMREEAQ